MTAEDAALTWFKRADEIETAYRANPSSPAVHHEANLAARGISALLQHRGAELRPSTIDALGVGVDRMARVAAATLDAASPSPWKAAIAGFTESIGEDLRHWKESAKHGAAAIPEGFKDLKWAMIGLAVLAFLIVLRR